MTRLYELTGELLEIENMISEEDITADQAKDTLEALEMEFNEKAINTVKVIENFKPSIDVIDQQIKKLQAKKKALQNKQESLREYLRSNMEACEITKIECPFFSITLKKPSQAVQIDNENALPDEFVTVKTTTAPDKKAILAALKKGEQVEGASLKTAKPALQIK